MAAVPVCYASIAFAGGGSGAGNTHDDKQGEEIQTKRKQSVMENNRGREKRGEGEEEHVYDLERRARWQPVGQFATSRSQLP